MNFSGKLPALLAAIGSLALLAGCSQSSNGLNSAGTSSALAKAIPSGSGQSTRGKRYRASARERECLARAMFFESNRSSRDGLVAVGSVVMNRLDTGKWGNDICSVVGAKRQFAPGVLSRPMNSKALPDVMDAADAVLAGERHGKVKQEVMFFHTAGLRFPYKNMHYTVVAGGNQFYEKRSRRMKPKDLPAIEPTLAPEVMIAAAPQGTAEGVPGVSTALAGSTPSTRQAPMLMASAAPMTSDRSRPIVQRRTSRDGGAPWREAQPATAVRLSPCRRARRKRSWRPPSPCRTLGSLPPIDLAPRKHSCRSRRQFPHHYQRRQWPVLRWSRVSTLPNRSWRSARATSRPARSASCW